MKLGPTGPVVPDGYHVFKRHKSSPIPQKKAVTETPIEDEKIRDFLAEIDEVFGQFSAWKLRDMTHEEDPYKEAPARGEISTDSMRRYCKRYLVSND